MKALKIILVYISFSQLIIGYNNDLNVAAPPEKKEVKVGIFDYYPGVFVDEDGETKGFIVDILEKIAAEENWDIKYIHGSWSEGLNRIQEGKLDILTSVAYTVERDNFLDYSKNDILTVWGEVYIREKSNVNGILELAGKKIGIMRDDFNGKAFMNLINSFHINCDVKIYENFQSIFEAVETDSVFAGVVNNIYGVASHDKYNLRSSEIIFNPFDIFFAVAEGRNRELLSAIDENLTEWKANHESTYYKSIENWTRKNINVRNIIPGWLSTLLYSLIFLTLLTVLFVVLLRNRVKRATKKIIEEEEKFRVLAESVNVINWEFNLKKNKWSYIAPQSESILGYKPEEWIDYDWWVERIHPEDQKQAVEFCEYETKKKNDHAFEYRFISKDGSIKWIHDIVNVQVKNDEPTILRGIMIDISEKKNAEKAVLESNRLSAIGEIASSIAHDFNNSLQSILGNLELALLNSEIPDSAKKYLDSIYIAANDSAQRIKTLQRFGSKKVDDRGLSGINITKLVEEVIQQSRPLWKDNAEKEGRKISIKTSFETNSLVIGDASELRSVFYNMVKNSVEAMHDGGIISISISNNADYTSVVISDTGIGMEEETRSRLFQPFYTTKGFEQGRGLGMSSAYSIIRDLGGKIKVLFTAPGKGTAIEVLLPTTTEEYLSKTTESVTSLNLRPSILWVDDDKMIREIAVNLMEALDYAGDVVESGEKALRLLQDNHYDLVITDIGMAGMSGWQLATAIRERYNSKIKIAFLSGWGEEIDNTQLKNYKVDYLLSKPCKINDLENLVHRAFHGSK